MGDVEAARAGRRPQPHQGARGQSEPRQGACLPRRLPRGLCTCSRAPRVPRSSISPPPCPIDRAPAGRAPCCRRPAPNVGVGPTWVGWRAAATACHALCARTHMHMPAVRAARGPAPPSTPPTTALGCCCWHAQLGCALTSPVAPADAAAVDRPRGALGALSGNPTSARWSVHGQSWRRALLLGSPCSPAARRHASSCAAAPPAPERQSLRFNAQLILVMLEQGQTEHSCLGWVLLLVGPHSCVG